MAEQELNGAVRRRRSNAEGARLVAEFERSGLGRKEFCAVHGLSVPTLDAWRRRVATSASEEQMVPVKIVGEYAGMRPGRPGVMERRGHFRIVLGDGLGIEVEPGFDAGPNPLLPPMCSLYYFLPVLDEIRSQPLPPGYLELPGSETPLGPRAACSPTDRPSPNRRSLKKPRFLMRANRTQHGRIEFHHAS